MFSGGDTNNFNVDKNRYCVLEYTYDSNSIIFVIENKIGNVL